MDSYILLAEAVTEFESDYNGIPAAEQNKHGLAIQQDELKALWEKTKSAYDKLINEGLSKDDAKAIKKKNKISFQSYVRCISAMGSQVEILTKANKDVEDRSVREHNIHLPPCDTDVFKGDYLSWPTFRDMFTAIYILNKRLTPVEKLVHLNNKTQGEAKDIVRKCPLTHEGFSTAWKNLCERYENKQSTLALWEQTIDQKTDIPKWEDMDRFLSNRFQTLETLAGLKGTTTVKAPKHQPARHHQEANTKRLGAFQASVSKFTCQMCQTNEHKLRNCPQFLNKTPADRIDFLKSKKWCLNCLSTGHTVSRCTNPFNCIKCHSRHNTLLHIETAQTKATTLGTSSDSATNSASTSNQAQAKRNSTKSNKHTSKNVKSCYANTNTGVLLGTARVNIYLNGTNYSARALIDSGSECSFITEKLKRRIHLPSKRMHAQVSGITNTTTAQVKEACNIELRSPVDPLFRLNTSVLVLAQLTGNLPTCHISAVTKQAFPDLILADKRFFVNEPVDLVLGGDIYPQIILSGLKKNILNTLLAQETVFGWIITGRTDTSNPGTNIVSYYSEVSLDKQLSAFWELEEIPKNKSLNEDDKYCEELYQKTTIRNNEGKYIVSLPFRKDFPGNISLGPSLERACSQFYRNETRLAKDPVLQKEYNRVLAEYETLGHMSKITIPIPADSSDNYFLPHHAVIKAESTSTKVRVVFNASSPTANGNSLNDVLFPGPVLQADLPILILRWRLYKYVFNSDIEKMYRQILVHNNHTKYQRIIFRTNPNDPISLYELKTVTFGINCAPYLAIRTLLQLADDVQSSHPIASNILRKCMYVDDVLSGGHTIDSAIKARDEISEVLQSAGFPLRKWTANSEQILNGIPKTDLLSEDFLAFEDTSAVKALGIRWNAHTDLFYFIARPLEKSDAVTKRAILSAIAKLFDPLGWLAPIIIVAKILMQNIWLEGTDWDETVSSTTLDRWQNFTQHYNEIDKVRIPRWVYFSPTDEIQIHGFCDASEKAYAASVYMRVKRDSKVFINLLLAKTRVAPVKTISLPRLELCGAVLLAEIVDSIINNLKLGHINIHLWTDSTIVLAWIRKPPCSWSTFVAHRITKIVEKVGNKNWLHVDSASNPADLASRGLPAYELVNNSLWWQGPSWLQEDNPKWPTQETDYSTVVEEKRTHVYTTKVNYTDILDRFSDFPRALRVLSYVMRFSQRTHRNTKASYQEKSRLISSHEIKATTQRLIKIYQQNYYSEEYRKLKAGNSIDSKSELLPLNPFIDKDGIIRAGCPV
ncbi:uncharacterized protein LOC118739735 [Rhagoletis pomonella]|uniref:uncharacterized protein LOC118739735 n=1 Tax=Rhagoletis pomonella TaxID=28610 RepID=UPI001785792B|nr:uncharacterized protein LOC118739735 [Rhagoletis pomonella]